MIINYRAWLPKPKMMVYDIETDDDLADIIKDNNEKQNNYILMQNTLVKDINGRYIFDGDVVIYPDISMGGIVRYKNGSYIVKIGKKCILPVDKELKIIGNIYEGEIYGH